MMVSNAAIRLRRLACLASLLAAVPVFALAAAAPADDPPPGADGSNNAALDLTKGVQLPKRDNNRLPADFVAAAKTQPVNPNWGKAAYKPKTRRDFYGIWLNQGGIGWTPGIPPGRGQKAPLTPEYAKIFDMHQANAAAGKPTGDITAACLPQGMPRIMTMTYPMEVSMAPDHVKIYAEWQEQTRRIYTDGRPLDPEPDPTFYGQSVGHWEGDVLAVTAFGFRQDTNLEASGLPKSDKMITYERFWLADDDTLRDEITLVDPLALARPWTVTKTYKRAPADFKLMPYVCLENNRNPVAADGSIGAVLKGND
jgi:hypothetical protein